MSTEDHVLDSLPGYALNCLDEEELVSISEHLAGCETCQAHLHAYQAIVDQLPLALPQAEPPPRLKQQLMARIRPAEIQPSRWQVFSNFMRRTAPVWGVVGLLLIVLLAAGGLLLWQRLNRLEAVTQPNQMQTIMLAGTQAAPKASGLIVLSLDGRHGTLVVDHLPVLDPAHEYQLWLIRDDRRASGAVFSVNKDGYGSVWVSSPEPLANYSSFGVSIEPAGGSPAPTGSKVLGGSVN